MPLLNELARKSADGTSTFADLFHIVHVYTIEAHPKAPDFSPYCGTVWEIGYSDVPQGNTYEERTANAVKMFRRVEGEQIFLVDELEPEVLVNPAWCTYGTAPNPGYLIRQDGIIEKAMAWVDIDSMEVAARAMLARARER